MLEIKGLSGAPGLVKGNAVIIKSDKPCLDKASVSNPNGEYQEVERGRQKYNEALIRLAEESKAAHGQEAAAIFEAYQEIIQDDVFFGQIKDIILSEGVCASYAIEKKRADVEEMFSALDDEYLKARATDINNVCRELMSELQGISTADPFAKVEGNDLVVFAEDLSPADTVRLDRSRLKGMVTERGGITSHTVILAKSLGIPAIVGSGPMPDKIVTGATVLLDGATGLVTIFPDDGQLADFEKKLNKAAHRTQLYNTCRAKPATTRDGFTIRVNVNSGDKESIERFDPASCDGVGLFRTEFLYMGQTAYPTEEAQLAVYKDMAERAHGKELIIRTLDIGGDKQLDYMNLPLEDNPFLGYRAIRLCLDRVDVFKTQLRAILRSSAHGNVKIMFPMIVNLEELLSAKELLSECMAELDAQGIPFSRNIPVGIMVETPAAVLLSDILAKHVNFFSIGSNDLIQYTTATDRMNGAVQYLYDNCNLSFLRAVGIVCESACANNIEVGICGETASEPRLIPLWCAMGVHELSVAPTLVGRTKHIVTQISKSDAIKRMNMLFISGRISDAKSELDKTIEDLGI